MHVVAAKAVCFKEAMSQEFKDYQFQVVKNAKALAETLSAGGVRLVSGGTDNHLMLADVMSMGVTGRDMQELLDRALYVIYPSIPSTSSRRTWAAACASAPPPPPRAG